MPCTLLFSVLTLAYLGSASAWLETSTIEKSFELKGKTYQCMFNLTHDDEESVLYTEKSTVECSPKAEDKKLVTEVELEDDEGHIFMIDFQMSPDKIIYGEFEALTPWEEFEAHEIVEIEDDKRYPCAARDQRLGGNETLRTLMDTNRGVQGDEVELWPKGIVPYAFDYSFTKSDRLVFAKAVEKIEEKTCIRFRPKRNEESYWLQVKRACHCETGDCFGGGWADKLGADTPASLSIGKMCMNPESESDVGLTAHEMLHNLGIGHTQTRPDRDDYIRIIEKNMKDGGPAQYEKCFSCKLNGVPYDCSSIMHYSDYDFALESDVEDPNTEAYYKPTMIAKDKNTCDLSSAHHFLTDADIQLIKAMYPCQETKAVDGGWAFWSAWSTCKKGSQKRFRLCNNPKPSGGGKKCTGKNKETQKCSTKLKEKCPNDETNTEGRKNVATSDYGFGDISNWANSWKECANYCHIHETCHYWTWYKPLPDEQYYENSHGCVLMEDYKSTVHDSNAVSGSYTCGEPEEETEVAEEPCKEDNVNTQGRVESEKTNTESWEECAQKCNEKESCTHWTWHHEGAGWYHKRCITMAGYANKVVDNNAITGSKNC